MPEQRFTDEQVFNALRAAAAATDRELGGIPSLSYRAYEYWRLTHPEAITASWIERRWGTWSRALTEAGLPADQRPPQPWRWSDTQIVEALVCCAEELGHRPSPDEYQQWSANNRAPRRQTVTDRFRLWNTALSEAGF